MDRSIQLTRGLIDLKTGEFPATVATNGEASDGHILDIRTMRVADRVKMFANHDSDVIGGRLGHLHSPRKVGKSTRLGGASLKMMGRIDVEQDGILGDIRRDVAHGISVGDVTAMSVRWDPRSEGMTETARNALSKTHFAFSEVAGGFNTPMFIEHAEVLENSIVGLGSDQEAMIGRSENLEKPEHVRSFWRTLVESGAIDEADEPIEHTDWVEVDCEEGRALVPPDVAAVWGQSIEEEITPEPEAPEEQTGREEPGHSGEELDIPARIVPSGSSAVTDEIAAFMLEAQSRTDENIRTAQARMLFERLGIISQ